MLEFEKLLRKSVELGASDLHLTVGVPPNMRINGELQPYGIDKLIPDDLEEYVKFILNEEQYHKYNEAGEIDLSFSSTGIGRFRVNVFKQRGSSAIVLRIVTQQVPTLDSLGMPNVLTTLTTKQRGLILVTGPTGSGKSTTLAAMINEINSSRGGHIITLEEPVEYLHKHKKSIVNQREVGFDTKSYGNALRAALREDPDVILVGEMRDLETIAITMTAAETGHLVLSTIHTVSAAQSIDRIIDVFPPYQQQQIRVQLAAVLEGIISQQLIPTSDNMGRVAALEIMTGTPAIRSLIREGKTHQLDSAIQTSSSHGMKTMDMSLVELYKRGKISYDNLMTHCIDKDIISRLIKVI